MAEKNNMTSTLYECIVCQQPSVSVTDLHHHHVQCHTLEELSLKVLNFQGFKTLDGPTTNDSTVNLRYNNSNKSLYENVTVKTGKRTYIKHRNREENNANSSSKEDAVSGHDNATCMVNCSEFIAWERELYKTIKIDDDTFFDSIDSLCKDLNQAKRRGRKRKNRTVAESTCTSSKLETNACKEIKEEEEKDVKLIDDHISEMSVAATSHNTELNSVPNVTVKAEVLEVQLTDKTSIETPNTESETLHEVDANNEILTFNPVNGTFSWTSLNALNSDLTEIMSHIQVETEFEAEHFDKENVESFSTSVHASQSLSCKIQSSN